MAVVTVPVIYDRISKKILRWYILDFDRQLADPAFNPQNPSEGIFKIPMTTYKMLAGADPAKPLLNKLQDHVSGNAP